MPVLSEIWPRLRYVRERLEERAVRALPVSTLNVTCTRPIVSFTFDDVPSTAQSAGARILEHSGVCGTFYIAGGLLGKSEPDRELISVEGCRSLADAGHEIGCHTYAHRAVRTLGGLELAEDLDRNRHLLDQFSPTTERRNFAYPYNQGSLRHRKVFAKRFTTARGGGDRINRGAINRSYLWGMEIRQPESDALSLTNQIDALIARPGWLIFFTHDISEMPTPYGCTPDTFSILVRYAVSKGCLILPVRDALQHVHD